MGKSAASLTISLTAIVVLLAIVLAFISTPLWLLLILFPILCVPILRRVGILRDMDERQQVNNFRSGNLAFYATVLMAIAVIVDYWVSPSIELLNKVSTPEYEVPSVLYTILLVAVTVKLFSNLVINFPLRRAGLIIGSVCGSLWILFAAIISSVSSSRVIFIWIFGFVVLIPSAIAYFVPRIGGSLLVLVGIVFICYFFIFSLQGPWRVDQIAFQFALYPLPVILAGLVFIASVRLERREEIEEASAESAKHKVIAEKLGT